jgi:hypothetical protein
MVFTLILPQPRSTRSAKEGKHDKDIQHGQKSTKKNTNTSEQAGNKVCKYLERHKYWPFN